MNGDFADLWPSDTLDADTVNPLLLLDWPLLWAVWRTKVGEPTAGERMEQATMEAMNQHGVRYALVIGEKLERATMVMEEWTPDAATATEEEVMASVRAMLKPPPPSQIENEEWS